MYSPANSLSPVEGFTNNNLFDTIATSYPMSVDHVRCSTNTPFSDTQSQPDSSTSGSSNGGMGMPRLTPAHSDPRVANLLQTPPQYSLAVMRPLPHPHHQQPHAGVWSPAATACSADDSDNYSFTSSPGYRFHPAMTAAVGYHTPMVPSPAMTGSPYLMAADGSLDADSGMLFRSLSEQSSTEHQQTHQQTHQQQQAVLANRYTYDPYEFPGSYSPMAHNQPRTMGYPSPSPGQLPEELEEVSKAEASLSPVTSMVTPASIDDNAQDAAAAAAAGGTPVKAAAAAGKTTDIPYAQLIMRALMGAPGQRLSLQGIYEWFQANTAKGQGKGKGWQNSIRHNLSMNGAFIKADGPGDSRKTPIWTLTEDAKVKGVMSTTRFRKPQVSRRDRTAVSGSRGRKMVAAHSAKAGRRAEAATSGGSGGSPSKGAGAHHRHPDADQKLVLEQHQELLARANTTFGQVHQPRQGHHHMDLTAFQHLAPAYHGHLASAAHQPRSMPHTPTELYGPARNGFLGPDGYGASGLVSIGPENIETTATTQPQFSPVTQQHQAQQPNGLPIMPSHAMLPGPTTGYPEPNAAAASFYSWGDDSGHWTASTRQ